MKKSSDTNQEENGSKPAPTPDESKVLRPSKNVNYCEVSSQESNASQDNQR